jgi:hypothetical protein
MVQGVCWVPTVDDNNQTSTSTSGCRLPNPAKGELAPAREGRRRANLPRVRALLQLLQDWQLEGRVGNWQFGQDEACAPVIDGSDSRHGLRTAAVMEQTTARRRRVGETQTAT